MPQILAWADAFEQRVGRWPRANVDRVIAGSLGEKWPNVNAALKRGHRGLPGGATLAQLLAEHRGMRNQGNLPPLTVDRILVWADAFHKKTGRWPHAHRGAIAGSGGETWSGIDHALTQGDRGLPRRHVPSADPRRAPEPSQPMGLPDGPGHPRLGG